MASRVIRASLSKCSKTNSLQRLFSLSNCSYGQLRTASCYALLKSGGPISFNGSDSSSGFDLIQKRFYNRKKTIKIPPTKPLNFDYGGDLAYDDYPLDLKAPKVELDGAEQLQHVDDLIKRLLSVEFADGQEKLKRRIHDLVSKVQEHPLDVRSLEVVIAYQTVAIRNQIRHVVNFRKDKAAKNLLILRLQARKKHLRRLRSRDYEKFIWLCEELQMKYVPIPQYNRKPSKAATIKKKAREAALKEMSKRMREFRLKLQEEKEEFLKVKARELERIEKELEELQLEGNSHLLHVFNIMKSGNILDLDGNPKPLKSRRDMILEHKFKLAEAVAREREAKAS